MNDDPVMVEVRWATSAGDFLPFTALPKAYHGKTVQLVIVEPLPLVPTCAKEDVPWALA